MNSAFLLLGRTDDFLAGRMECLWNQVLGLRRSNTHIGLGYLGFNNDGTELKGRVGVLSKQHAGHSGGKTGTS
jgi:hypothetical protein